MWETISAKFEKGKIPKELKPYIAEKCPVCGKPRMGNDEMTEVKCLNFYCIKYVKNRAKSMFDYLGVKNIGPETCERYLHMYKVKSHVELIPKVMKEKPALYLWEIAKISAIPGLSDKLQAVFDGYPTFNEYFEEAVDIPPIIMTFKDKLIQYQDYFKIKPTLSKNSIVVMITGGITGFPNKQKYVDFCNDLFGHIIKTEMKKSVKAKFLITEHPEIETDKIRIARERGIKVITPNEYKVYLLYRVNPSNTQLAQMVKRLLD